MGLEWERNRELVERLRKEIDAVVNDYISEVRNRRSRASWAGFLLKFLSAFVWSSSSGLKTRRVNYAEGF